MFDKAVISIFKIVSELLLPAEIKDGLNFKVDQIGNDVSVVDISSDERNCNFMVKWFEISSNQLS